MNKIPLLVTSVLLALTMQSCADTNDELTTSSSDTAVASEKVDVINAANTDEAAVIQEKIVAPILGMSPNLVANDPVKLDTGYYEVELSGGPTLYVADDASHFYSGEMYRVKADGSFENVKEQKLSKRRQEGLANIDPKDLIIYKPEGETKAVINVFTDVTCGYCRKLHNELEDYLALGLEIRYFAFPRTGVQRNGEHTNEYLQTSKAWCSDDRAAAMTTMKTGSGKVEALPNCDLSMIPEHYNLGVQFGINGTPAIVLEDGTLVAGYRPASMFAEMLEL